MSKKDKRKHKKEKRVPEYESSQKPKLCDETLDPQKKEKKKHKKDADRKKKIDTTKLNVKQEDTPSPNTIQIIIPEKKKSYETGVAPVEDLTLVGGRVVSSSAQEFQPIVVQTNSSDLATNTSQPRDVTLLLFYQYIEPLWTEDQFQAILQFVQDKGHEYSITGRMRVAHEGLNCTLTGSFINIRSWCRALRDYEQGGKKYFAQTEFKFTDDLPRGQAFPKLHAFPVDELVNYGLDGKQQAIPSIHMTGVHLEPQEYHKKIMEPDTIIIDVRNHYEATIGRFDPPTEGAIYIDPNMRKSTEFPSWLDKSSTKELLRGKQVLMYCTGGVRCERASALLRTKMETEEDVKALGIKGVYQLQGGIDKYFKNFPDGGYWKGKNYVFDKRFAHAPPLIEGLERAQKLKETFMMESTNVASSSTGTFKRGEEEDDDKPNLEEQESIQSPEKKKRKKDKDTKATTIHNIPTSNMCQDLAVESKVVILTPQENADAFNIIPTVMGKCESCHKPWDRYRGKRRCPTCGVPSLICKECYDADVEGIRLLGPSIRCDLCVAENITSKKQLTQRMDQEQEQYEQKIKKSKIAAIGGGTSVPDSTRRDSSVHSTKRDYASSRKGSGELQNHTLSHEKSTRLHIKNMCVKRMDQETLILYIPNMTHIQWTTDRKTGQWFGSAFVEMKSLEDAAYAVNEVNGIQIFGRPIRITYSPADPKDKWPLPNTCIV